MLLAFSCSEEKLKIAPQGTVDQNILNLTTDEDFFTYSSEIDGNGNSKISGRKAEKKLGFTSFDDIYNQALKELSEAEDQDQEKSILNKYSDVVILLDSAYQPRIGVSIYRKICNRNRIYQTGDIVHKVLDDQFMVSTDKGKLDELTKLNSVDNLDLKTFKLLRYSDGGYSGGRTAGTCGNLWNIDYFENNSGCRDDRRVWAFAQAVFINTGSINGFQRLLPWVNVNIHGQIRNRLCNWNSYATVLSYRNVSFTVLSYQNTSSDPIFTSSIRVPYSASSPDFSSGSDSYGITIFDRSTGTPIVGENVTIGGPYQFTQIRVEATSRGVNGNYAVINCQ